MSTTYAQSFEIVHSLAGQNQIDAIDVAFASDDLAVQAKWQSEALNTLEDLVTNHSDAIDDRFPAPAREAIEPARFDEVAASRDMDPSDPVSALRICLDMARNNVLDDPEMAEESERQAEAIEFAEDFVIRHGGDLSAAMTAIKL